MSPHRSSLTALALLLAACSPDESTTPTTAKLAGYWLNQYAAKAYTIFGFESGADAPWELPLEENMVSAGGKPVSAVYQADDVVNVPTLVQLVTPRQDGQAYVVEYDAGGAYQGAAALPVASPYYGLRALDTGAIVVAGSTAQRLGKGLSLGTAVALPSPTGQLLPTSPGLGDEGVGAILLGGSGDMDFQSMSAGGFVLVDFSPGP